MNRLEDLVLRYLTALDDFRNRDTTGESVSQAECELRAYVWKADGIATRRAAAAEAEAERKNARIAHSFSRIHEHAAPIADWQQRVWRTIELERQPEATVLPGAPSWPRRVWDWLLRGWS